MAIKLKIPSSSSGQRNPLLRIVVALSIIFVLCCFGVFAFYYIRYDRIISKRMSGQIFSTSAKIYARPITVRPGDKISPAQIAAMLRRSSYVDANAQPDAPMGTYRMSSGGIEVHPGPESYHSTDAAKILSGPDGRVDRILGVNHD